ncbi:MAG TPA: hypothetical protein ENJ60_13185 [Aeromonadales bacterium]|nr:hypothetical protein [Aeromonadales bacterium]
MKQFITRFLSMKTALMAFLFLQLTACQTRHVDYHKITVFSPSEVKQDAAYLLRILKDVDISAWENISEKDFQKKLQNTIENNFWLQSRLDVFRDFAPLVASLGEIHSQLIYPNNLSQTDGFYNEFFPLLVLCEEEGIFVAKDMSEREIIPSGAEILSINGIGIEQLIANMSRFVPKETAAGQRRLIQVNFEQLLTRELGLKAPFTLEWRLGYLKTKTYYPQQKISAVTIPETQDKSETQAKGNEFIRYGIRYLDNDVAILWLTDFESPPEKFKNYLNKIFPELTQKGINKLVIDLRYNSGGIGDNVLTLLSFLEDKSIQWTKKITLKNSKAFRSLNRKRVKQAKREKLGSKLDWLPTEYLSGWNWDLLFGSNGEVIEQQIKPEPLQPTDNRYQGALGVITNGHCFSACALFVDYIQQSGRGVIVGEDAGSLVGIQYGYPILMTLPNTGLQISVPVARIQSSDKAYKVVPDIKISRRQEDIANARDPELAGAISSLIALTKE